MTAIARLLELSPTAVLTWLRSFAESHATKPEPAEDGVVVVELDEMWPYLKKIQQTLDPESFPESLLS